MLYFILGAFGGALIAVLALVRTLRDSITETDPLARLTLRSIRRTALRATEKTPDATLDSIVDLVDEWEETK